MSKNLEAKLQKNKTFGKASLVKSRGQSTLLLTAIAECRKQCRSELASLCIPTEEGNVEINGFLLNKNLAKIFAQDLMIQKDWPNLSADIRHEIETNNFSGHIDVIIGQDNLWRLVLAGIVVHPSEDFGIWKTKLGWTIGGKIPAIQPRKWQQDLADQFEVYYQEADVLSEKSNKQIEKSLFKLFEQDEDLENNEYTVEEQYAIETFEKNIKREADGRYTVSPLFRKPDVKLKNNYYLALKRYRALRKTLERDELKNKTYCEAIKQLIAKGEVEEVNEDPRKTKNMDACLNFLPHHGVFKMDRISTKCRIVFDGSAKNSEGISLNENLLPGPRRQLDIILLLINFRLHPYTIVGDISRMFHQINIDPRYRDLYRFLWHDDAAKEPKVFRFKRLTMGSVDSPFLAINTVHHHLDSVAKSHSKLKKAAKFIKDHLYVDDLLGAVDSIEEAIEIRKQIQDIFAMMKMKITKWSSNSSSLLRTIPKEELSPHEEIASENTETKTTDGDKDEDNITFGDPDIISQTTKCLGMSWVPKTDIFDYHSYESLSQLEGKTLKLTKRGVSSVIPRIYDPTGLLQPFILKGKLILQSAWVHKDKNNKSLGWDDQLPDEIKNRWLKWIKEIKESSKFQVHRYIFKDAPEIPTANQLQLHGFADAGELAWGIAIYLRFFNSKLKRYESHLIYSATRVAPTNNKLSIPRKELNAILLCCEKLKYISQALNIADNNIYAHSDSLVSLHWIQKDYNSLKTYVANRVKKIQDSRIKILFVPGKQNPADLCSKPQPGKDYINNSFWTNGPSYIQGKDDSWMKEQELENILKLQIPEQDEDLLAGELKPQIQATVLLADVEEPPHAEITSGKEDEVSEEINKGTEKTRSSNQKLKDEHGGPDGIYQVLNRYSNFHSALNIVAQCFRALALMTKGMKNKERGKEILRGFEITRLPIEISQAMSEEDKRKIHITPSASEIEFARRFLIIEAQKTYHSEEYYALVRGEKIPEKSQLIKLNPQLNRGVMIMKGRLDNLHSMPEQMKNPIILPRGAKITEKIILQHHQKSAHAGPELTLRQVRLYYWVLGGRQQVRKAIRRCGHWLCKYPNPQAATQQIANLPIARIRPGNFEAISLDFAGPFTIKRCGVCKYQKNCSKCQQEIKKKSSNTQCSTQKVYVCVFCCHSSRAVHLELLMDRTTESFILAIKRMSNRRGMPKIIHSDNASEMVLAKNHIKALYEKLNTPETHKRLISKHNITWYHSTERSPAHNGLIERIVQVVKRPLYKVLDGKLLSETEMNTILTDCEAASNMRPLSATSESADDCNLLPLTPSHLINVQALNPLPDELNQHEEKATKKDIKHRWNIRKRISNHYWQLWREEYLTTLRELTKNYCEKTDLKKGDVVLDLLSYKEKSSRSFWPLAVVEQALKGRVAGKEDKVRSVWLRHPIPAEKITKEGKQLTQHKYSRRGIEQVSLLEEVLEEGSGQEPK